MAVESSDQQGFIEQYIPLVDFLGQAMGPNVEVVLHDLDVPDRSVVAIANGHISGRKIGGPVTDFALWFMKQGGAEHLPMLTGYRAVNPEGRICRSSSYFLRDKNNTMRGMLCINVDMSHWSQLQQTVSRALDAVGFVHVSEEQTAVLDGSDRPSLQDRRRVSELAPAGAPPDNEKRSKALPDKIAQPEVPEAEPITENLRADVQNLLESMLDQATARYETQPERLQRDERLSIITFLEESGFFLLKGGITAAAERLGVSEPTIYRDLVRVRNQM